MNSSFSAIRPNLQLAIDSTSLGEFKQCPRKYQLGILQGWQGRQGLHHLEFGLLMHAAREQFYALRAAGASYQFALRSVFKAAAAATWDAQLGRPTLVEDSIKNRQSLLRTIVWYFEKYESGQEGSPAPVKTFILSNGRAAVELSFRFDSGVTSRDGEPFLLCGHLDRIIELNGEPYIDDLKTTGHALDKKWFSSFTPDNQFTLYILAGQIVWSMPTTSLVLDGAQIGVGFSRFQRGLVSRSAESLDEWMADTARWIRQLEDCAREGHWPMNDKACGNYGGCRFRDICGRSPGQREEWLARGFGKRVWDPLQVRGDV